MDYSRLGDINDEIKRREKEQRKIKRTDKNWRKNLIYKRNIIRLEGLYKEREMYF